MCIIIKIKLVVTCRFTCCNVQLQCIGMFIARCLIIYLYIFRIQTFSSGIYYCRIGESFQIIDCIRSGKSCYRYQLIQSCCVSQTSVWTCGICYSKFQGSFLDSYGCFNVFSGFDHIVILDTILVFQQRACRKICRCKDKFLFLLIIFHIYDSTVITFKNQVFKIFFYFFFCTLCQCIIT